MHPNWASTKLNLGINTEIQTEIKGKRRSLGAISITRHLFYLEADVMQNFILFRSINIKQLRRSSSFIALSSKTFNSSKSCFYLNLFIRSLMQLQAVKAVDHLCLLK